ncbi:hypothetical protein HK100_007744 [Physocladia obscura]|uniref:Apple domain-containing protein n=1 Tax=Physocladia obscura TaxID=109957 RepID=A0AAD5XFQ6_9FUNG|nr:hypothetical protein HK100_007744 [Physocladia obscura]
MHVVGLQVLLAALVVLALWPGILAANLKKGRRQNSLGSGANLNQTQTDSSNATAAIPATATLAVLSSSWTPTVSGISTSTITTIPSAVVFIQKPYVTTVTETFTVVTSFVITLFPTPTMTHNATATRTSTTTSHSPISTIKVGKIPRVPSVFLNGTKVSWLELNSNLQNGSTNPTLNVNISLSGQLSTQPSNHGFLFSQEFVSVSDPFNLTLIVYDQVFFTGINLLSLPQNATGGNLASATSTYSNFSMNVVVSVEGLQYGFSLSTTAGNFTYSGAFNSAPDWTYSNTVQFGSPIPISAAFSIEGFQPQSFVFAPQCHTNDLADFSPSPGVPLSSIFKPAQVIANVPNINCCATQCASTPWCSMFVLEAQSCFLYDFYLTESLYALQSNRTRYEWTGPYRTGNTAFTTSPAFVSTSVAVDPQPGVGSLFYRILTTTNINTCKVECHGDSRCNTVLYSLGTCYFSGAPILSTDFPSSDPSAVVLTAQKSDAPLIAINNYNHTGAWMSAADAFCNPLANSSRLQCISIVVPQVVNGVALSLILVKTVGIVYFDIRTGDGQAYFLSTLDMTTVGAFSVLRMQLYNVVSVTAVTSSDDTTSIWSVLSGATLEFESPIAYILENAYYEQFATILSLSQVSASARFVGADFLALDNSTVFGSSSPPVFARTLLPPAANACSSPTNARPIVLGCQDSWLCSFQCGQGLIGSTYTLLSSFAVSTSRLSYLTVPGTAIRLQNSTVMSTFTISSLGKTFTGILVSTGGVQNPGITGSMWNLYALVLSLGASNARLYNTTDFDDILNHFNQVLATNILPIPASSSALSVATPLQVMNLQYADVGPTRFGLVVQTAANQLSQRLLYNSLNVLPTPVAPTDWNFVYRYRFAVNSPLATLNALGAGILQTNIPILQYALVPDATFVVSAFMFAISEVGKLGFEALDSTIEVIIQSLASTQSQALLYAMLQYRSMISPAEDASAAFYNAPPYSLADYQQFLSSYNQIMQIEVAKNITQSITNSQNFLTQQIETSKRVVLGALYNSTIDIENEVAHFANETFKAIHDVTTDLSSFCNNAFGAIGGLANAGLELQDQQLDTALAQWNTYMEQYDASKANFQNFAGKLPGLNDHLNLVVNQAINLMENPPCDFWCSFTHVVEIGAMVASLITGFGAIADVAIAADAAVGALDIGSMVDSVADGIDGLLGAAADDLSGAVSDISSIDDAVGDFTSTVSNTVGQVQGFLNNIQGVTKQFQSISIIITVGQNFENAVLNANMSSSFGNVLVTAKQVQGEAYSVSNSVSSAVSLFSRRQTVDPDASLSDIATVLSSAIQQLQAVDIGATIASYDKSKSSIDDICGGQLAPYINQIDSSICGTLDNTYNELISLVTSMGQTTNDLVRDKDTVFQDIQNVMMYAQLKAKDAQYQQECQQYNTTQIIANIPTPTASLDFRSSFLANYNANAQFSMLLNSPTFIMNLFMYIQGYCSALFYLYPDDYENGGGNCNGITGANPATLLSASPEDFLQIIDSTVGADLVSSGNGNSIEFIGSPDFTTKAFGGDEIYKLDAIIPVKQFFANDSDLYNNFFANPGQGSLNFTVFNFMSFANYKSNSDLTDNILVNFVMPFLSTQNESPLCSSGSGIVTFNVQLSQPFYRYSSKGEMFKYLGNPYITTSSYYLLDNNMPPIPPSASNSPCGVINNGIEFLDSPSLSPFATYTITYSGNPIPDAFDNTDTELSIYISGQFWM